MRASLVVVCSLILGVSAALGSAPAKLLGPDDLRYEGAFRLPGAPTDQNGFEYGGTALAWYPEHGSLLLVGRDWFQRVAEIAIPAVRRGAGSRRRAVRMCRRRPFVRRGHGIPVGSWTRV